MHEKGQRALAAGFESYWLTWFMPIVNSDTARSLDKLADPAASIS
jgi:hypothetical protein